MRIYFGLQQQERMIPTDATRTRESAAYTTPGVTYGSFDNFAAMRYSPLLCYEPAPSRSGRGYSTNAQGFRLTYDLAATKKTLRIFFYGGSTAWGAGCGQETSYFAVLEKVLNQGSPALRVEVVPAGVGAYVSSQEVSRFVYGGLDHAPDLVVFLSGWNDTYLGYRGKDTRRGHDTLNYGSALSACFDRRLLETTKIGSFMGSSYIPQYDDYALKLHYLLAKATWTSGAVAAGPQSQPLPPEVAARRACENLLPALGAAREHAVPLVYALQPDLYTTTKPLHEEERGLLEGYRKTYPGLRDYFAQTYPRVASAIRDLADRSPELTFVDVEEGLRQRSSEDCDFVDHVHFGEVGQRWLGVYFAEVLGPMVERLRAKAEASGPR